MLINRKFYLLVKFIDWAHILFINLVLVTCVKLDLLINMKFVLVKVIKLDLHVNYYFEIVKLD